MATCRVTRRTCIPQTSKDTRPVVLPSSKPAYELDFERLVEELLRQVQAPFTGTLFISSDDGEKGRVGFERGHILGLSWGSTQGEAALDRLRVAGRFRVTPSVHVVFSTPHSLPSTFDILRGLM